LRQYENDTIIALATPPGEGGIAILRISGEASISILEGIFYPKRKIAVREMESHKMYYGWIGDGKERIDEALVVIMRGPKSYTREDTVEIHCHGGIIPVRRILELCMKGGCRLAEPGEFTKRAFLNGRIDLAQAEAVMDLIQAKTDLAARSSVNQLEGHLSTRLKEVQERLLDMQALIEVNIDYPEEDVEEATLTQIHEEIDAMTKETKALLETADTGRIIREGLKTVIVGRPNVGKSSLLNALLRENRAIVTDVPGTTRDVLEEYMNIKGLLVRIIDTAGIRQTEDKVEAIGVSRSKESIEKADLILFIIDVTDELQDEDKEIFESIQDKKVVVVLNKIDAPAKISEEDVENWLPGVKVVTISAKELTGIDRLEDVIHRLVFQGELRHSSEIAITNARHKEALEKAVMSLKQALHTIDEGFPLDLLSIDLRDAWHAIGEITGQTVDEDIIDRIFSQFCLGK
jgi:tRNA modification GTPase